MADKRFDSLHVDIDGHLPGSQGFTYPLTIVDRFTRWPEAIPLSDISALTCARAFLYHWDSRYNGPSTLTSERGRQSVSELWRKTAALLGTANNSTTPHHPQSNGMIERMHRTVKAALKAKLVSDPNWIDVQPVVMLGMRAAVKQDLNCSAAGMVFDGALRLPGEFFVSADGDLAADPAFVVDLRQNRCDRYRRFGTVARHSGTMCHEIWLRLHMCLCESECTEAHYNRHIRGPLK